MNEKTVAIYGAGSIGAMKPDQYDSPSTKHPLTHAHAVYNLEQQGQPIRLGPIFDADGYAEADARAKWDARPCSDKDVDIVVISCPTDLHHEVAAAAINKHSPSVIVVEKPFCKDLKTAKLLSNQAEDRGVKIVTNYTRRFCPEFWRMKAIIAAESPVAVRLVYGRGLYREASHAIDLFSLWLGKFISAELGNTKIKDGIGDDLSVSAEIEFENGYAQLLPFNSGNYGVFEIDVFTTEGRYRFPENGRFIVENKKSEESVYGKYETLSDVHQTRPTGIEDCLTNLYKEIIDGRQFSSTAKNAIQVHEILGELR